MKTRSTLPTYGGRVTRIGRERVSVKEDWNRETANREPASSRRSSFSVRVTQRRVTRA